MKENSQLTNGLAFDEAVAYMSGLVPFAARSDREPFRRLLALIGNPQEALQCIHIAGTNGKGSTTTFIASVLSAAGYRVGAYLSPYVFDMRERYLINGALIPKEDFARLVTMLRPHIEAVTADGRGQITEFELKTAVAFAYFAEQCVDFAVIEVGIGGRLDSTNVISSPLCAVIVSIGWDHMNLLGDTLGKIAFEKSGIFKPGTVAVTAVPPGEALSMIASRAEEVGIPLHRVQPLGSGQSEPAFATFSGLPSTRLTVSLPTITLSDLRLTLSGAYQATNAATAAAAIETLRMRGLAQVSPESFRFGLEHARLPGRFQMIRRGDVTLILDGAHNEDGAKTLLEALQAEFGVSVRFTFVLGMSKNHDPLPFLCVLAPFAKEIVATEPPFKPRPIEDVVSAAKQFALPVTAISEAREAIQSAVEQAEAGEVIVVTGSFYTVGETPEELRE